ncbi:MAG: glycerol kinase [Candidatus Margulisbacteria bacterium]|nr:glycerol kinase [Candidatus Margulisiibacteriota bacterium]
MVILSLDLGTTGNRAIAFSIDGKVVAESYKEFPQIFPKPGWVEHDPMVIWESVLHVVSDVVKKIGADSIQAVGITNQRETTVVWDKRTGIPVHNAIVWQCRRTAEMCARYESSKEMIKQKTGLFLDAYFSATKIRWILENVPNLDLDYLAFGTIDSWILWQLTQGKVHATDTSNASRTMLLNIRTLSYDDDLLKLFDIPKSILPEVKESGGFFGDVDAALFGKAWPIMAILGDQQASLFAQTGLKNTYGTGLFVAASTGSKIVETDRLISTVAFSFEGKTEYAIEGSVFVGGSVIQWLRDGLKIIKTSKETETLALSLSSNEGVYFIPALVGLGAPYWRSDVRGQIVGLTRGTSVAHIVRAALESLAYQTRDVVEELRRVFPAFAYTKLCVDGGACKNNFLMQFQADILGLEVERPMVTETTAFGVAGLAGMAIGFWTEAEFRALRLVDRVFSPALSVEAQDAAYSGWLVSVKKLLC